MRAHQLFHLPTSANPPIMVPCISSPAAAQPSKRMRLASSKACLTIQTIFVLTHLLSAILSLISDPRTLQSETECNIQEAEWLGALHTFLCIQRGACQLRCCAVCQHHRLLKPGSVQSRGRRSLGMAMQMVRLHRSLLVHVVLKPKRCIRSRLRGI